MPAGRPGDERLSWRTTGIDRLRGITPGAGHSVARGRDHHEVIWCDLGARRAGLPDASRGVERPEFQTMVGPGGEQVTPQ